MTCSQGGSRVWDGDGFLSVTELNNAMMSLGFNHSEVELQDMILDADENGR